MAEVLIRDVSEAVLAGVDAHAARLGLSRVEYIRRRLASDAASSRTMVSVDDLRSFADRFTDLADVEIMGRPGGDTSGWSTSPHWCALPPLLTAGSVRIGPSEAWSGHNGHRAGDRLRPLVVRQTPVRCSRPHLSRQCQWST